MKTIKEGFKQFEEIFSKITKLNGEITFNRTEMRSIEKKQNDLIDNLKWQVDNIDRAVEVE